MLSLHRIREDDSSKRFFFLNFQSAHEAPTYRAFHLSNLLQMPNDQRMVNVEFFNSFSCSCKSISFDDCSQLVIVRFWWMVTTLLIFRALISFAKLLEPPLHCTFISSSWAKCIDVVSGLCCLQPILNSNKKIAWICCLSNIISIVQNKYTQQVISH